MAIRIISLLLAAAGVLAAGARGQTPNFEPEQVAGLTGIYNMNNG
jgi:hypothetical protein